MYSNQIDTIAKIDPLKLYKTSKKVATDQVLEILGGTYVSRWVSKVAFRI